MPVRSRVWPDPRVKPPYGAAELESHPLASQMIAAYLLQGTGTAFDSVGPNNLPAQVNRVPYFASVVGSAAQIRSTTYFGYGTPGSDNWPHGPTSYPVSMYALSAAATGDNGSNRAAVHLTSAGAVWMFRLGWAGTSGTPIFGMAGSGISGSVQGANVWTHLVGVATSATSRSLWVNGVQAGTSSSSESFITPVNLLLREAFAGDPFADLATVYIWARALSASDVRWISTEPYAMFRPIVRRRYFVAAAAVPSPSFTPPVGSMVFAPIGAARYQDFRLTPMTA